MAFVFPKGEKVFLKRARLMLGRSNTISAPLRLFGILALFALPLLTACGGGGGGDDEDFAGAGNASMRVTPTTIDIGDRAQIRIEISQINEDGIIVKIRMPEGIRYVPDTAQLLVDGDETDLTPDRDVLVDDDVFVVFFLEQEDFDDDFRGVLELQIKGLEKVSSGDIEVDIDVDDPLIPNDIEFDPEEPEFQAEDSVTISVRS
jgi:hypothetical protein